MYKLTNHITLFCSHDATEYLHVRYIDSILGLDQNEFTSCTLSIVIYSYEMSYQIRQFGLYHIFSARIL